MRLLYFEILFFEVNLNIYLLKEKNLFLNIFARKLIEHSFPQLDTSSGM